MASSTSFFGASSSSSSNSSISVPKIYDVFLSFRGEDTRYTFTDHLFQALVKRGIRTFRDDEQLRRGEAIAPELLKAIEDSRSSVIIFSENYAHSGWCLDELVKIMDCQKDVGHTIFPIFYHVDPSHVRSQTGRFGEAFAGYEKNLKDNVKVGRWRTALREAGNLSGWHLQPQDGYESNYIKKITNMIFRQLNCKRLDVGTNLVGIASRINKVNLLLHMGSNDIRIIGICGVGGIGKTTIAKVIYNELSWEFEYMSFLENIGKMSNTKGLPHLKNQLRDDIEDGDRAATMIKKKVFIVLDDVDHFEQLECLLGNGGWLGEGSRVIITTRNKHLLTFQGADYMYEVPGLNPKEAIQLFSLYAFKQKLPKLDFIDLSHRMMCYCQGLPLALKVLGSLLFNQTIPQWESELHKLEREPEKKIHDVLKRSYEGLGSTEKDILLDVACFFGDEEDKDFVSRILDGCKFHAERGLKNLNDMCLITIPYNKIQMHDLIRRMAWEIVREGYPRKPNKWSRLWDPHDIDSALTTYKGIHGVETLSLDLCKLKRVRFNPNVLAKMTSLRLLKVHSGVFSYFYESSIADEYYDVIIENASKMKLGLDFEFPSYELRYLRWDGYPLEFLPSNFDGENLIELHLWCSNIKQLWQGNKYLERLKVVDMSYSKKLIQMPEFSSMSNLEKLDLQGCVSLIDIHPSIGVLKKLATLYLMGCVKLKGLPSSIINLEALEVLDLSRCSSFDKFPEIQGNMSSLKELRLYKTAIRELPNGIDLESVEILVLGSEFEKFPKNGANMKSLKQLYLKNTAVKELPTGIANWESLPILDLSYCSKFEKFPEKVGNMKRLRNLCLNNTVVKDLPDSIGDLEYLEVLDLSNCSKFEKFPEKVGNKKRLKEVCLKNTAVKDLPNSIGDLEYLEVLDLSDCSKFEKFPEKVGNMKRLWNLRLKNTAVKDLPNSIGDLEYLEVLDLSDCSKFEKFPEKVGNMKRLRNLCLKNTAVKDLPDSIRDLEYLEVLDLSDCSKFEKFPENVGNMKRLEVLLLNNIVIKDLPYNIGNLEYLEYLDLSDCSKFEKFSKKVGYVKRFKDLDLKYPWLVEKYSIKGLTEVGDNAVEEERVVHEENNIGSRADDSLPYPHDAEMEVEAEEPLYKRFGAVIREESNGNHWRSSDDSEADAVEEKPQYESLGEVMLLDLLGNFGETEAETETEAEEPLYKRFGAVIREESNGNNWRSSDDSEADAVEEEPQYESLGEVMLLDLLGNFGETETETEAEEPLYKRFGAVIREESNGNHWGSSDDSEADAVEEEPQYESLGEVMLLDLLGNFGDNEAKVETEAEAEEPLYKRFGAPNTNLSL